MQLGGIKIPNINLLEDYPCGFCGWADGEHAPGCLRNPDDYPQDKEELGYDAASIFQAMSLGFPEA